MSQIRLRYAGYNDSQSKFIDFFNENMRQLNWLLNQGHLGADNSTSISTSINMEYPEQGPAVDEFGVNPVYMKYYPNKCFNSSFEVYDPTTMLPTYWDTNGVCSASSEFDNTYSLKLEPLQYAIQEEDTNLVGKWDPAWWSWCPDTRISFRAKGNGGLMRVSVWQGGVAQPITVTTWNSKGEAVDTAYTYWDVASAVDWPVALFNFKVTPSGSGKCALRFDNIGDVDIYFDAVTIEADWTGRYPSFYTHGPRSGGTTGGIEYEEYGSLDWSASGVTFVLNQAYDNQPVVAAGVQGTASDFNSASFNLVVEHITETIAGASRYSQVKITPKGSSVPTPTGAKITMRAICWGAVAKS